MTYSKDSIIYTSELICFLISAVGLCISCKGQYNAKQIEQGGAEVTSFSNEQKPLASKATDTSADDDLNVISIYQDSKGVFWFGTQNQGVYRYDGNEFTHYTEQDGLANNQIQTIQEDKAGHIWFGTGAFGVSQYDGLTFTTLTDKDGIKKNVPTASSWKMAPDDLWFFAGGGVYRFDGKSLTYLALEETGFGSSPMQSPPDRLGPYAVYCTLIDKGGNLWMGTQAMGVCRYDGKKLTWYTEHGLAGPAVLALFEDKNGNIWFGNNGSGLFKYDPVADKLTNFTKEEGLSNDEFRTSGKPGPGTLARIYSINEDRNGNLWIGTVDAGVWRYDGSNLKNYTTLHGLPGYAVITMYKDRDDELWFGTEEGVYTFNGISFTRFSIL
jgi:ligand-binding sensor domain-containing protein